MKRLTKEDWLPWNEERQRFLEHETEGFVDDIVALEAHIRKLTEVAPKDKANWPEYRCLEVIDKLRADLERAKVWRGQMP